MPTVESGAALELRVDGAEIQDRMKVAFRAILLVPLALCSIGMYLAFSAVVVCGWIAALALGHLPKWTVTFELRALNWFARVNAYAYFLTDYYPPFSLAACPAFPLEIAVEPGPLERVGVLVRIFVLIPYGVAFAFVSLGAALVSPALWIVVLIGGQAPVSMHDAMVACLRFELRCLAFAAMVSTTLPRALFGDVEVQAPAPSRPSPFAWSRGAKETAAHSDFDPWNPMSRPDAPVAPPLDPFGFRIPAVADSDTPEGGVEQGEALDDDQTGESESEREDPWALRLSSSARAILVAVLVLGGIGYLREVLWTVGPSNAGAEQITATRALDSDYMSMRAKADLFDAAVGGCRPGARGFACQRVLESTYAGDITHFVIEVSGIAVPQTAMAAKASLISDANQIVRDVRALSTQPSRTAYAASPALKNLQIARAALAHDYGALAISVGS